MNVILAGYNVDRDVLDELKAGSAPRLDVTPEILSAAYARISRDPRPANELRRAARAEVEAARRSNRTIIFRMGHQSVAEHAVFNFDILGISRLAIEEIERFRLGSYTEKSQRYIALGNDFVVPAELAADANRELFLATVRAQNALYHDLLARLRSHVLRRNAALAADPAGHALPDGAAKEDARYIVSLATEGQLGMTVNARTLELMIRRLAARPLAELRELRRCLYDAAREVAPSLLRYTEASAFDAESASRRAASAGEAGTPSARRKARGKAARLADATPDGDGRILAAILHGEPEAGYGEAFDRLAALPLRRKRALFRRVLAGLEFYDAPPREFEFADLTFELTLSASCFAQLKRHRLATLIVQPYDPALGATVPPSVVAAGAEREFRAMIARTDAAHAALKARVGPAADYVLTNAHRRRALLKVNLRELYHISRLREDAAAQWDIRALVAEMSALARKAFPLAGMLLGGKDAYPAIQARVFGRPPAAVPPRSLK